MMTVSPLTSTPMRRWYCAQSKIFSRLSAVVVEIITLSQSRLFTPHSHHHIYVVYWYTKHPGAHSYSHHIYIVYWYTKHPGAHSLFTRGARVYLCTPPRVRGLHLVVFFIFQQELTS